MNDSPKEDMTIEKRSKIFKQELAILREKKLIPKTDYLRISNAYERHVHQVNQMENQARLIREKRGKRTNSSYRCSNKCNGKKSETRDTVTN